MAIAHPAIIELFSKVQMPYKLPSVVLELAERALSEQSHAYAVALQQQIKVNREVMATMLAEPLMTRHGIGPVIGGRAANFLLVPVLVRGLRDEARAKRLTDLLRERYAISIRYVGAQARCRGCVRITVGTADEIDALRGALRTLLSEGE